MTCTQINVEKFYDVIYDIYQLTVGEVYKPEKSNLTLRCSKKRQGDCHQRF